MGLATKDYGQNQNVVSRKKLFYFIIKCIILLFIFFFFYGKGISFEEAFQFIDQDFDGMISKEDLSNFLEKELKVQKEQLSSMNIDRLFKLIDFSKKGFIYKSDLQKILMNEDSKGLWLPNVKQQVGLFLTKEFQGLKQSFESFILFFSIKIVIVFFRRNFQTFQ